MDCSLPGSSAHVIFQARVLEWGAIAFSTLGVYSRLNNLHFTFFKKKKNSEYSTSYLVSHTNCYFPWMLSLSSHSLRPSISALVWMMPQTATDSGSSDTGRSSLEQDGESNWPWLSGLKTLQDAFKSLELWKSVRKNCLMLNMFTLFTD